MSSRLLVLALIALSCSIALAQSLPVQQMAHNADAFGDASFREARVGEKGFFNTVKKIGSRVANVAENLFRRPEAPPAPVAMAAPLPEEEPPAVIEQPKPRRPETPEISIPEASATTINSKCTERDSGCFAAILRSKEAKAGSDPLEVQLFTELKDIKASLDAHTRGISNEENWIGNVQEIMKTYADKIKLVRDHIIGEHKLIKNLNKKKHQLRTLIKQRRIEAQIQAATDSLKVIQGEIDQVDAKKTEFDKNKDALSNQITQLQQDLQHMSPGGSSTGAANGTSVLTTSAAGSISGTGAASASTGSAGTSASSSAAAPAAAPASK